MSEILQNHAPQAHAAPDAGADAQEYAERRRQALANMFVGVAPGIIQARKAFLRDLPELLKNPKYDRWCVAYYQEERIALADSQTEVIRECVKRGLKNDEYFIGSVVPYDDEEWEIDKSLYEFDDIE